MSQTVADRIQLRMSELGLAQADLMRATGAARGSVSGWVNGSNSPSAKHLEALTKALKTNSTWLLTGNGASSVDYQIKEKLDNTSCAISTTEIDPETKIWIPLVDVHFSCGHGESIEFHYDETKRMLAFDPDFFVSRAVKAKNTKVMYAKGDSMEMYISDGDVFAIDTSDVEIRDGKIYAVYFEGEAMLKQIFKEAGGKLILHSMNNKYRDKEVTEQNGANFKVMGRQFWRAG